jgi:hypothetical protein
MFTMCVCLFFFPFSFNGSRLAKRWILEPGIQYHANAALPSHKVSFQFFRPFSSLCICLYIVKLDHLYSGVHSLCLGVKWWEHRFKSFPSIKVVDDALFSNHANRSITFLRGALLHNQYF